jgi:hypothetical protein
VGLADYFCVTCAQRSGHSDPVTHGIQFFDCESRNFGHFYSELLRETGRVVGEDHRFVTGAGDSDIAEARPEQVGVESRCQRKSDALGGETLGAVAGDGISVLTVL